jgi:hypothetical protein
MRKIQVLLPGGTGVEQSAMHGGKRSPLLVKISGRTLNIDHAGQKACNQFIAHAEFRKLLLERVAVDRGRLPPVDSSRGDAFRSRSVLEQGIREEPVPACIVERAHRCSLAERGLVMVFILNNRL